VSGTQVRDSLDFERIFGRGSDSRGIELEIGCGKGRFLVEAAARWPDRDFLAIEQVRALVRKVRDRALRAGLTNVRLFNGNAVDVLTRLIPDASLSRVHVYFPDPWPKRRHAKHRLFADPVPDALARVLRPGGELLLATDSDPYFREVVARLQAHGDFVRVLTDVFDEIPRGGFDAIFASAGVPIFRGCWQRRR
jgi:tRNA (guanine-N7-)-methyltransferase